MLNLSSEQLTRMLLAGRAHLQARRFAEAQQIFLQAAAIFPASAEPHQELGILFLLAQRHDQAIAAFTKSLDLKPAPEPFLNLIQLHLFTGNLPQSVAIARRAAAAFPDDPRIACELGRVLERAGHTDEALDILQRAHHRWPDVSLIILQLAGIQFMLGRIPQVIKLCRDFLQNYPQDIRIHDTLLYTLHFSPGISAGELLREHQEWNRRHATPLLPTTTPQTNHPDPNRRLRIGYISGDFRNHSVGRFMAPLLDSHDHQNFEIFAYSDVHTPDPLTHRMQRAVDHWRPIFSRPDHQVADLIRADAIDILVDLTMHMPGNRLLLFARKPAPIQISYLAYVSTTGISAIDYRLSDPFLDPDPAADNRYTEKTIRLPSYWCFEPEASAPEILPRLPGTPITFGCLSNIAKVSLQAIETWSKILSALPTSRLILHCMEGRRRQELLTQFASHQIAPNRIEFAGRLPLPAYLSLHHRIDISLDPFPYSGGTTTCDALWMGVPLITLAGPLPIGRGGVSILNQIALPELIAGTIDEYIQIAINLANTPEKLAQLRQSIRPLMQASPLMNKSAFAHSIQNAYRQIIHQITP